MRRIGLMGGSFNPIHLAHAALARSALCGGYVDEVWVLPTGNPPHKREGLADKESRYDMACLAVDGEANICVSRAEIDREGTIYSVDTLTLLRSQNPDCELYFIIGEDTLFQLHTWRRIEDVITLCTFLVCQRPGEDDSAAGSMADGWRARGAKIVFMRAPEMNISSTMVREALMQGRSVTDMLPLAVEQYIRVNALYNAKPDDGMDAMKREKMLYKLKKSLDRQRFEHTLGVEETAREMAKCFGEDEDKAALAGLLHDCAKCMTLTQMVKAAKGEAIDPLMKESKALMHSLAGMCVARDVYNVADEDVLSAIRWHTTGHADMSALEKIIYLADMIEPNRKPYPGLEALRRLCFEDLDGAMLAALRGSLAHVQEQGKTLHPDTLAALASYEHD